jgi:hypothetical protein
VWNNGLVKSHIPYQLFSLSISLQRGPHSSCSHGLHGGSSTSASSSHHRRSRFAATAGSSSSRCRPPAPVRAAAAPLASTAAVESAHVLMPLSAATSSSPRSRSAWPTARAGQHAAIAHRRAPRRRGRSRRLPWLARRSGAQTPMRASNSRVG